MLIQPLPPYSPRIQQDEFLRRALLELDAEISLVIETPKPQPQSASKKVVIK